MDRFHVKSILLGVGIGIIITGFISVIYFSGYSPENELSEQDIKQMAREYGMVEKNEIPLENEGNSISISITKNQTWNELINELLDKNIINSEIEFRTQVKKLGKEQKLKPGNYIIKSSQTLEEIINTITID